MTTPTYPPPGLEEAQTQDSDREELHQKLKKQVADERIKKQEAINKLAQIMYQRQNTRGLSQRQEPRKAHEREIRKLRGELQRETQRSRHVVEKYQQQLEEIKQV